MTVIPDGKRYSPLDRDSVHDDMRIALEQTLRAIAKQPGVKRAHEGCQVCAELNPRISYNTSRRAKVVLGLADVAAGLNLPPGARPIRMWVTDDPQLLQLVFEADELDEVLLNVETPYAVLPAVDE